MNTYKPLILGERAHAHVRLVGFAAAVQRELELDQPPGPPILGVYSSGRARLARRASSLLAS